MFKPKFGNLDMTPEEISEEIKLYESHGWKYTTYKERGEIKDVFVSPPELFSKKYDTEKLNISEDECLKMLGKHLEFGNKRQIGALKILGYMKLIHNYKEPGKNIDLKMYQFGNL